jgi:hypothetical protein
MLNLRLDVEPQIKNWTNYLTTIPQWEQDLIGYKSIEQIESLEKLQRYLREDCEGTLTITSGIYLSPNERNLHYAWQISTPEDKLVNGTGTMETHHHYATRLRAESTGALAGITFLLRIVEFIGREKIRCPRCTQSSTPPAKDSSPL